MSSIKRLGRAVLIGVVASTTSSVALGWHTEDDRVTDGSAYTEPERTLRVGLTGTRWGIIDRFTVGTSFLQWGLLQSPNVNAKLGVVRWDPLSVSLGTGVSYVDTDWLLWFDVGDDAHARVLVVPARLYTSVRISKRWSWHSGLEQTFVKVYGRYDPSEVQGALVTSNMRAVGTLEWRPYRFMAVLLLARYMIFQTVGGTVGFDVPVDDRTSVAGTATATTGAFDFPHAFAVVPSVHLSWKRLNLRYGVGYGNYMIPGVNFTLPRRGVVPMVDVWWRFDL